MEQPRVLVADDDERVLESVRRLLETQCEVVGTVSNGQSLLAAIETLRPDVAVVDISMPLLNGFQAARQLKNTHPGTRIIFLTVHDEPGAVNEALSLGVRGYVLKRCASSDLLPAICQVLQGKVYISSALQQ